jgi:hypothetical protein
MGASVFLAFGGVAVISAPSMAAGCQPKSDYFLIEGQTAGTYLLQFRNTAAECDWTVPAGVTNLEVAVVGGGGAAGTFNMGGGGGGQVQYSSNLAVTPAQSFVIGVGLGGAKATADNRPGGSGGTSKFGNVTAKGGGGGGGSHPCIACAAYNRDGMKATGLNGGSSGGNSPWTTEASTFNLTQNTFDGWTSFQNAGGAGVYLGVDLNSGGSSASSYRAGGGGGGAMSAGGNATLTPVPNQPGKQNLLYGLGGKSVRLMGMCLGGGGDATSMSSSHPDVGLATTNSKSSDCVSPEDQTVLSGSTNPSGGFINNPPVAFSGGGGSYTSDNTKTFNASTYYPGATGTVLVKFRVSAPTITTNSVGPSGLTISGTGVAGAGLTLSGPGISASTTVLNTGSWSVALSSGTYNSMSSTTSLTATQTIATQSWTGTADTTDVRTVTKSIAKDATAPAAPSAATLATASNSGSTSDSITKYRTPTLEIGNVEQNAKTRITLKQGQTTIDTYESALNSGSLGSVSVTLPSLSDGV